MDPDFPNIEGAWWRQKQAIENIAWMGPGEESWETGELGWEEASKEEHNKQASLCFKKGIHKGLLPPKAAH